MPHNSRGLMENARYRTLRPYCRPAWLLLAIELVLLAACASSPEPQQGVETAPEVHVGDPQDSAPVNEDYPQRVLEVEDGLGACFLLPIGDLGTPLSEVGK